MEDFTKLRLVGQAPAFQTALRLVEKCAECDATVLIEGETGTGKELAARAIHYLSVRRRYPFIPINCGAIPDSLIENELFGHTKGAYTDARESYRGLIANAEGGTLFLDEIEALSPKGQVVLLRFLQDHSYRPLGSRSQTVGNVRVLVASNTDLAALTKQGSFRQDLLYRLTILTVKMPPLRERPGDPTLLARHFVQRMAREYSRPEVTLDDRAIDVLTRHSWPGNVRELENVIQRAFLLTDSSRLQFDEPGFPETSSNLRSRLDVGQHLPLELGFARAKAVVVAEFERDIVVRALAESRGNVSEAARLLRKERRALGKLIRKHGIDRSLYG